MKPVMRLAAPVALALILLAAACGGGSGGGTPGPGGGGPNLLENPSAEQNVDGYIGHNGAARAGRAAAPGACRRHRSGSFTPTDGQGYDADNKPHRPLLVAIVG